jgi:hypothetical protein
LISPWCSIEAGQSWDKKTSGFDSYRKVQRYKYKTANIYDGYQR